MAEMDMQLADLEAIVGDDGLIPGELMGGRGAVDQGWRGERLEVHAKKVERRRQHRLGPSSVAGALKSATQCARAGEPVNGRRR